MFSKERQTGVWVGWKQKWGGTERGRERGNHAWSIAYENRNLLSIKETTKKETTENPLLNYIY